MAKILEVTGSAGPTPPPPPPAAGAAGSGATTTGRGAAGGAPVAAKGETTPRIAKNVRLVHNIITHMETKASAESHGSILLSGDPGIGKAQPLDALIKTPTGWTNMGDIKVGDMVSTPDGDSTPIIGVFPQGQKQIYKIMFADGRIVKACGEHLWKIRKGHHAGEWEIKTTEQITLLLETTQLWIYVPLIDHNVSSADIDLPIDPYVLGCLLGDGGFSRVNGSIIFTNSDQEIVENVELKLDPGYILNKKITTKYDYILRNEDTIKFGGSPVKGKFYNLYKDKLNDLGLLGLHSKEKFIPEIYKNSSVDQKKEIVAGLVDTDGYVNKNGSLSISTSSNLMAADIQELVWSIGGIAKITVKKPVYFYKGERKTGAANYQISIRYPEPRLLSRLQRKIDRLPCEYQYKELDLRIVSIEEDGIEEAQCILVDHPDHLYITDNYVVTHNTTFIYFLTRILGMEVIVVEIPHITEEHIINIPFIVFNPLSHTEKTGHQQITQEYKLILSESNLYSLIKRAKKLPDNVYIHNLYKSPRDVIATYEHFGGTRDKIPEAFQEARNNFDIVLFLDEFFRQTSPRIRNMLRAILNSRIGSHTIPANTYIIYASNMNDSGLEDIPHNTQFTKVQMHNPDKDEWFDWLLAKFEQDEHVKLNMTVIKKFKEILESKDLSHDDPGSEVRTSPRRWEQLLLYINAALPAKDEADAKSLLTNVKANFHNYLTGKHSELAEKVLKAVAELIKATSNIDISHHSGNEGHEWRNTLSHQIAIKMKLGEHRKYIPVVSGAPGIGKAQPLDALIKIPDGWVEMGDIKVGDIVETPSGDLVPITGVFPQGKREVFRFTFSDGRVAEACDEHLWKVRLDHEQERWQVITTREIIEIISGHRKAYIPLVSSDNDDIELPLAPYLLGCILGDGSISSHVVQLTNTDAELLENVSSLLKEGYQLSKNGDTYTICQIQDKPARTQKGSYRNFYRQTLSDLELMGCKSLIKFIPNIYKRSSKKQKEALIAGLLDTDGYVNKQGSMSISTSSKRLAEDIQEIIWSIGGRAKLLSKVPVYSYNNEKKEGSVNFTVSIGYRDPKNLCRLSRKQERISENYQYADSDLKINSIDFIGVEEVQCIMVDHPEHLYITDNYVVTHNTQHSVVAAADNNLRFIDIDVSELNAEDVIGMPLPGKEHKEGMTTKFSQPKLYRQIMNKIEAADEEYIEKLRAEGGAEDHIRAYKNARWKYLILFDELNRTDEKTFNALRRVLLEKNFGPSGDDTGTILHLPPEAIVVAAINPHEASGITTEFTHHVRDVLDTIGATSSWKATVEYMKGKKVPKALDEGTKLAMDVITTFANKFKTRDASVPTDQRQFHIDAGADLYVSPREYSDLYALLVSRISKKIKEIRQIDPTQDPDALHKAQSELREVIYESMEHGIGFSFDKHMPGGGEEFLQSLKEWIMTTDDIDIGEGVIYKKAAFTGLEGVLGDYMEGKNLENLPNDQELVNYMSNTNVQRLVEHLSALIHDRIKDPKDAEKYIVKKSHKRKELKGEKIADGSKKASLLENLVLSLIYALHIHQFSNDQIAGVWKALSSSIASALGDIRSKHDLGDKFYDDMSKAEQETYDTQEALDQAGLELRMSMHTAISKLK